MVTILLSTYNGAKHLEEQLASIVAQEGVEVQLIVRDDGSTDGTCALLDQWQEQGRLTWYKGDNLGSAQSFLTLLRNAPASDYYAFADQDDYWLTNKMQAAVQKLQEVGDQPALYMSEKWIVDKELTPIVQTKSILHATFAESLVASDATGCTFVFNKQLLDQIATHLYTEVSMHDLWIYRLTKLMGYPIVRDTGAYIYYRQHEGNVVGYGKRNPIKRLFSAFAILSGYKKRRNYKLENLDIILAQFDSLLTASDRELLTKAVHYKDSLAKRVSFALDSRLVCTDRKRKIAFILLVLFC